MEPGQNIRVKKRRSKKPIYEISILIIFIYNKVELEKLK